MQAGGGKAACDLDAESFSVQSDTRELRGEDDGEGCCDLSSDFVLVV